MTVQGNGNIKIQNDLTENVRQLKLVASYIGQVLKSQDVCLKLKLSLTKALACVPWGLLFIDVRAGL